MKSKYRSLQVVINKKAMLPGMMLLILGSGQTAFSSGGGIVTEDASSLISGEKTVPYSPYAQRSFPDHPLWGDTHLHTAISFDAGAFGGYIVAAGCLSVRQG